MVVIGSPAQMEANSHICQCVTVPAWGRAAAQQERCHHPDQDHDGNREREDLGGLHRR